jgi:transposase
VLSPRTMHLIEDLAGDWRRLDERIEGLSTDITNLVAQDAACERLMTVPGIGTAYGANKGTCTGKEGAMT